MGGVVNGRLGVRITWERRPCMGRPLTRVWVGPDGRGGLVAGESGDTECGRAAEVEALLGGGLGGGWEAVP